jgi:hypothetical protein
VLRQVLKSLKKVVEKCGGKSRYWFVVLSDLKISDPFFDPIYYIAGSDTRVSLLEKEKCFSFPGLPEGTSSNTS